MGLGQKGLPPQNLPHISYKLGYTVQMIIPYLKNIQKYMNHVTHLISSAEISIFTQKSENFAILRNTGIDCILVQNF